jgi:glycerophosphoryl diester phosphodiesterase
MLFSRWPCSGRVRDTAYGRAIDEQITFLHAGIDGLFTDNSDIGVLARSLA